jgi:lipoate-protein ligase A
MALDEYLLRSAGRYRRFLWRLYKWEPAAVSIGRSQRVAEAVNPGVLAAEGISMIRRPTGGRAIWHSGDVCFTHAGITPGEPESPSAFKNDYIRAAEMVVRLLGLFGIDAEISSGRASAGMPRGTLKASCFQSPGRYEVTVAGRKIAGIAQCRSGERFLIQGSVRLAPMDDLCRELFFGHDDTDQASFERLLASVTSVEDELGTEVGWKRLIESFSVAVGGRPGATIDPDDPDSGVEQAQVLLLQREKYGDSRWNRRL